MPRRPRRLTVFPALLFLAAAPLVARTDPPNAASNDVDRTAREAADRFLQAVYGRDLEQLMAQVAVPWFHDGKTVLTERADVEQEFKQMQDKRRNDPSVPRWEVRTVIPYRAVRDQTAPAERRMLDQVLSPDDRLVLVHLQRPKAKGADAPPPEETVVLLVKVQGGKALIAGLKG